ncbi:MAG TPA: AI-2E family transporter [Casimicrobiaceae bacterium]|nr:AI-2E family transporter [Casimicrobiaceae bacterium]
MIASPDSPARRETIAAWIIVAVLLIAALEYRLLPALFAGLLVYELVHVITPKLPNTPAHYGKVVAVAILAIGVVAVSLVVFFAGLAFFRSENSGFDALVAKIAQIIETSRDRMPEWVLSSLPDDSESLKAETAAWLRTHASAIGLIGRHAAEGVVHVIIGMVIGGLVALREALPEKEHGPLAIALMTRASRLATAFGNIVFAQVRIAAINTAFTALYVLVALPLLGIHLPLKNTLVAITFIAGLLPVFGNLISNTFIVIASLSISPQLAIASLVFLVLIHKMEYFLNARIVGGRINASAWELLIAMLVMEAIFGLAGLIAAPVYYAYLKDELVAADLV